MRYTQLPWQPKMVRSAGQANLLGSQAWLLENVVAKSDGSIKKRWGSEPYSKYVLVKEPTDRCHKHDFSESDNWTSLDTHDPTSTSEIALFGDSTLRVWTDGSIVVSASTTHAPENTTTLADENRVAIRFLTQFVALPPLVATEYFYVEFPITASKMVQIRFAEDGVYAGDVLLAGSGIYINGSRHVWEAVVNVTAQTYTLYVDDIELKVGAVLSGASFATPGEAKIGVVSASSSVEVYVDYFYATSATAAGEAFWTTPHVRGLFEYENSIQATFAQGERYVICHCGTSVWADMDMDGRFKQIADNLVAIDGIPCYAVFRDRVYFTDSSNLKLMSWNTEGAAIQHATAPPCAMITPYAARLCVAGDPSFPLRLYFSGIRNANDWTTQSGGTFVTSGYLDMEEHEGGDRILSINGAWKGVLVAKTLRTIQVADMQGGNPALFSRRTIVYGIGGASVNDAAFVGNDLCFMSSRGVQQLQAIQEYGDIAQVYLSAPIDDMWTADVSDYKIIPSRRQYTWACSFPQRALALWAAALNDSATNSHILVYDYRIQTWYIWVLAAAAIARHTPTDESHETVLYADYSGNILVMNPHVVQDDATLLLGQNVGTNYTLAVETGRLDFRDYPDPNIQLRDHIKRFKTIHLHLKPKSTDDTLTLKVWTDTGSPSTYTIKHDQFAPKGLGDFLPNVHALQSSETVAVAPQAIDCHGKYIRFRIEQSSGDMELLGWEIEFMDEGSQREYGI